MSVQEEATTENDISEVAVVSSNDNSALYDRKRQSKAVRVLTVLAYVLSVSLAAILLSIYYIFVWDGQPTLAARISPQFHEAPGSTQQPYAGIQGMETPGNATESPMNKTGYIQDTSSPTLLTKHYYEHTNSDSERYFTETSMVNNDQNGNTNSQKSKRKAIFGNTTETLETHYSQHENLKSDSVQNSIVTSTLLSRNQEVSDRKNVSRNISALVINSEINSRKKHADISLVSSNDQNDKERLLKNERNKDYENRTENDMSYQNEHKKLESYSKQAPSNCQSEENVTERPLKFPNQQNGTKSEWRKRLINETKNAFTDAKEKVEHDGDHSHVGHRSTKNAGKNRTEEELIRKYDRIAFSGYWNGSTSLSKKDDRNGALVQSAEMSCKLPLNNSFKANCDPIHWSKAPSTDVNVKFAGEEAKDRLYEPKHKKKAVRVLTVVAYIFFVSLAAIMLSLYYVFIWNGHQKENMRLKTVLVPVSSRCDNENLQIRLPVPTVEYEDTTVVSTTGTEENSTWLPELNDYNSDYGEFDKGSIFIKKLFRHQNLIPK